MLSCFFLPPEQGPGSAAAATVATRSATPRRKMSAASPSRQLSRLLSAKEQVNLPKNVGVVKSMHRRKGPKYADKLKTPDSVSSRGDTSVTQEEVGMMMVMVVVVTMVAVVV